MCLLEFGYRVKWTSDAVSMAPKTYNKHGLTPRPDIFFCVVV